MSFKEFTSAVDQAKRNLQDEILNQVRNECVRLSKLKPYKGRQVVFTNSYGHGYRFMTSDGESIVSNKKLGSGLCALAYKYGNSIIPQVQIRVQDGVLISEWDE